MDDDVLSALVSGGRQGSDQMQAIVSQLRNKNDLGALASMSGDPALAPFGHQVLQQNAAEANELGTRAIQNQRDDTQNANISRQIDQGQRALAETIRYHNMEDSERKQALAEKNKMTGDVADAQSTIDKIGNYELPLPVNRSARNAAIIDELSRQYPNYDSTKYDEKKQAQKAFGSGKQGDLVRSADVSVQHLDTADQLASGLHNGSIPWINTVHNFYRNMTGDPSVQKFNTAKDIVADEVNKFIIGGGGALADREGLQAKLQAANSPEQLNGVTSTLRTLMGGQIGGLQQQWTSAGLGDADTFYKSKLKPHTLQALGIQLDSPPPTNALPGANPAPPGPTSGPPGSAVPGAPQAAPGASGRLTVVRTGTRNGKKVAQMSDGSIVEQ